MNKGIKEMKKVIFTVLFFLPFYLTAQVSSLPVASDKNVYTLQNSGYSVGFSDLYGLPVWSRYVYNPTLKTGVINVEEDWVTDSRIKSNRTTVKEFDSLNLCKTQLYPKTHATTNSEVQKGTYLTSNILPMSASLKEFIWDRITEEIEELSPSCGNITVYSGPVFEQDFTRNRYLINNRVVMPKSFYRLYVYYQDDKAFYKCYKFANHAPTDFERKCELNTFSYNLYQLEAETGIDFFDSSVDVFFRKDKMKYLESHVNQ